MADLIPPRTRSGPTAPVPTPTTPITGGIFLGQGFSPIPDRPARVPAVAIQHSERESRAVTDALEQTESSNERQQATVAGENTLIPILYGRRPLGAKLSALALYNGNLMLRCIWCLGEIDAIESYTINDLPPPTGVTAVHYLGTQTQLADPGFVTAYASGGVTYTDRLLGVAYSVITITPAASLSGFPRPAAMIRGMKVNEITSAYVNLNGSSQYFSTPHSATATVNEDFNIEAMIAPTDWTPAAEQTIVSKWSGASAQFRFAVTATGALTLYLSNDGIAVSHQFTSTVATGYPDASARFVRVALVKSNGANSTATFYLSDNGTAWTQLGAVVTGAIVVNMHTSNAAVLVGAYSGGAYLAGKVYYTRVVTSAKLVLEFVPWDQAPSLTTWTGGAGEVWTQVGGAAINAGMLVYSEYPCFALADIIRSTRYGMGKKVDFKSLLYLYYLNATTIVDGALTEVRHKIALALDTSQECKDWLNVLREYAHCWTIREGDRYYLRRDFVESVTASFDEDSILEGSMISVDKRGARDQPTCVEVTYSNATTIPWRDDTVTAYFPGVLAGTVPRRMQRVSKIGITRHSEANRDAIEWLNDATLADTSISFRVADNGALPQVGDVINVTHSVGFVDKPFRVSKTEPYELGRWTLVCTEYDPALYSYVIATAPTFADTSLVGPGAPPAVTGLAVTEVAERNRDGNWRSVIKLTWDTPTFPFVANYQIIIYKAIYTFGAQGVSTALSPTPYYTTPPLKENELYIAHVSIVSTSGAVGPFASISITPLGKATFPPTAQPLTGVDAGGRVVLNWGASAETDNAGYVVRRGEVTDTWETATDIGTVKALSLSNLEPVAGTFRYFLKEIDSVGGVSATAQTVDVPITGRLRINPGLNTFILGPDIDGFTTINAQLMFDPERGYFSYTMGGNNIGAVCVGNTITAVGTDAGVVALTGLSAQAGTPKAGRDTAAAVDSNAGFFWPYVELFSSTINSVGGFYVVFRFSLGTINSNARFAVGLSALVASSGALPGATIEPSTLLNCVLVGADSGDTNLQLMHNDGAGTCTKVDLGDVARTADVIELAIYHAQGNFAEYSLIYSIVNNNYNTFNGDNAFATNMPAKNVMMAPFAYVNTGPTIATANRFYLTSAAFRSGRLSHNYY